MKIIEENKTTLFEIIGSSVCLLSAGNIMRYYNAGVLHERITETIVCALAIAATLLYAVYIDKKNKDKG